MSNVSTTRKDAKPVMPSKPPQSPLLLFQRFKTLMSTQQFPGLGATGKGVLTISGGLASFPWDGRDVAELIERNAGQLAVAVGLALRSFEEL